MIILLIRMTEKLLKYTAYIIFVLRYWIFIRQNYWYLPTYYVYFYFKNPEDLPRTP